MVFIEEVGGSMIMRIETVSEEGIRKFEIKERHIKEVKNLLEYDSEESCSL